jgi:AmmeMemoRadiSam system protein A
VSAPPEPALLSEEEARALLALARQAIAAAVSGSALPDWKTPHERLGRAQGVFVTLRRSGRLRGCIGVLAADQPLGLNVVRCAASAACEDPRFPSVSAEESADLEVEISLLNVPRTVVDPEEIEVGRHGVLVTDGRRRGLLLPQVAIEHGWDRDTFLREACRKAGLDPEAWRRGARIEIFGAQIVQAEGRKGLG